MSRSPLFSQLSRVVRVAAYCDAQRLRTEEGLARLAESAERRDRARARADADAVTPLGRRDFLKSLAPAAALLALGPRRSDARPLPDRRVVIVGGGLAGLICADQLARAGLVATIYEGAQRLGGRCHSYRGFPGQVVDRGGEMIDNLGKTMLGYAKEFKLELEDLNKAPGAPVFFFNGASYTEADVVNEWRAFVARVHPDTSALSRQPTALSFTPADQQLDRTDLATYLATRGAGLPLIQGVLSAAYISEYGREPAEQSSLNLLEFIHLDRRSKFNPYGASDERWHIVGGNDQIVSRIAARLPGPVVLGAALQALRKNAAGELELTFSGQPSVVKADAVVLAIPFSTLREVALDASLGLSPQKRNAIQQLGYGHNCKTFVGFQGRPWASAGQNGSIYADLPNLQNTWESNWTRAGATSVLTDYAGGKRGKDLQVLSPGFYCFSCHTPPNFFPVRYDLIDAQADLFLQDLDRVLPGARAAASRGADGHYVLHRTHWLPQAMSRGSYTSYLPGQFTTIAGLEGQPVGPLYFAGEHTDSFYEWQGYMEGAARSGVAAAKSLLADLK